MLHGNVVVQNDTYVITDIPLRDNEDNDKTAYTYSKTTLNRAKQTRGHKHTTTDEIYLFSKVDGMGVMIVGDESFLVKEHSLVYVPKGKFHRVINPTCDTMIFETISPGAISRPSLSTTTATATVKD